MLINRLLYGAGALLLTLPGALRPEPANPAAVAGKSPILLRTAELNWEPCTAALPRGPRCAALEGDRTVAGAPFTYRLTLPDGYQIPAHVHPIDGHLTVIAGTLNIGFGDNFDMKATKPMPAGSFIVIPRGSPHFYWAQGETVVQSHGIGAWGVTYVNPADDPRKK